MSKEEIKEVNKEDTGFEDIKPKSEKIKGEKSIFSKIINVVLWIIVIAWMGICVMDYVKTVNEEKPMFCLKEEIKEYDDGTVYECTGLGYKYYDYNRTSYNATQFGGLWIKEHDPLSN